MTKEQINSIFQNKTFLKRLLEEIDKGQDWLLNYELGNAYIPEENGYGTVYTKTEGVDGQHRLYPTIMEEDLGLKYFGDKAADVSYDKGYGIYFDSDNEASGFGELLSLLHKLSSETQSSYEIK